MSHVSTFLASLTSLFGETPVTQMTVLADTKCSTATMNGKLGTLLMVSACAVSSLVQIITTSTLTNANVYVTSTKSAKTKLLMVHFTKWCGTKKAVSAYANPKK